MLGRVTGKRPAAVPLEVAFKRAFILPGLVLAALEVVIVLWPLVAGSVQLEAPGALEIFFSPADTNAPPRPSVEEFRALTRERLASNENFRRFTSYAGHRRGVPSAPPSGADGLPRDEPWIADLSFPDGAVIGFAGGRVEFLSREELGLGPDDPIVAGEGSRSPILRTLAE